MTQLLKHIKVHSVFVRLLHNLSYFFVQIINKSASRVIYDFIEGFKSHSTFADVSIEESNANHYVRKLTELGYFFWGCQRDKRSESSTG